MNNQDQALYKLSQIFQGDKEAKRKFEHVASLATFGFWGPIQMPGQWRSSLTKNITCIQLIRQHCLLQNIRIAMLKEFVGLGSQQYCIVFNRASNFYSKLKMIMVYLPLEKTF